MGNSLCKVDQLSDLLPSVKTYKYTLVLQAKWHTQLVTWHQFWMHSVLYLVVCSGSRVSPIQVSKPWPDVGISQMAKVPSWGTNSCQYGRSECLCQRATDLRSVAQIRYPLTRVHINRAEHPEEVQLFRFQTGSHLQTGHWSLASTKRIKALFCSPFLPNAWEAPSPPQLSIIQICDHFW